MTGSRVDDMHDFVRDTKPYLIVVQEDPLDRQAMRQALGDAYDVATVGDGFDLLSQVLERKPDLIVLDLVLPGIPGLEVIHALQTTGQDIPIIAMSST